MAAGKLNSRIDLLRDVDTVEPLTGESTTTYTAIHSRIPAEREDVSGGQTRRGMQVEATVRTVFKTPRISGINTSAGAHWRVQLDDGSAEGPVFEVISVVEREDQRRQFTELHCSGVLS